MTVAIQHISRNDYILKHIHLVEKIAQKISYSLPKHVDSDDRFHDSDSRQENRQSLKIILQDKFKDLNFEEVKERLLPTGIVFNKVITTAEVINGPQTKANGMFMDIDGSYF